MGGLGNDPTYTCHPDTEGQETGGLGNDLAYNCHPNSEEETGGDWVMLTVRVSKKHSLQIY